MSKFAKGDMVIWKPMTNFPFERPAINIVRADSNRRIFGEGPFEVVHCSEAGHVTFKVPDATSKKKSATREIIVLSECLTLAPKKPDKAAKAAE